LQSLSGALSGAVAECAGDSSTFMPRSCLTELVAALCDPQLMDAERRLCASRPDEVGPVTAAIHRLLSLGNAVVSVSRGVSVPLCVALLSGATDSAVPRVAELLAKILLHREAVIADGAFTYATDQAACALDPDGPGGERALSTLCPKAEALRQKYGSTPGLARIVLLGALDTLVSRSAPKTPASVAATMKALLATLRTTLEQILDPPGKKPVANRPPTAMPWSVQHRIQCRGWQALLVLGSRTDAETGSVLVPELFWHLQTPHVPDVREYQELLGCVLCERFEDLAVRQHLVPALARFDVAVQVSASLMIISCYVFRQWAAAVESGKPLSPLAASLILAVVPYLSHNSAYVRGFAAWGFFHIVNSVDDPEALLGTHAKVPMDMFRFQASHKECIKMRGRTQPIFMRFDPSVRVSLESLTDDCIVLPMLPDRAEQAAVDEKVPSVYSFVDSDFRPTQTFLDLLREEVASEMDTMWDRQDPTLNLTSSEEWRSLLQSSLQGVGQVGEACGDALDSVRPQAGPQRKFAPPAGASSEVNSVRRQPLVVVASLVDKTPNLAGLCRTSEVFCCEALCVPNLKIMSDKTFLSMSVTAEKWLPLREVPPEDLRRQLLLWRQRGYELVGVEQTHDSVPLDQWQFAEGGTVLVLGAEKEGISADVLPLLDGCVEIPQSGQIRSLNVHVSGSLAIWEYTKQQRDKQQQSSAAVLEPLAN